MTQPSETPYQSLERIFHEPNRLAIMSALGGAVDGLIFTELKEQCNLTDGNLSRHLKALDEARAINIQKTFVGARPRTTVYLTDAGRASFVSYLQNLEVVLRHAAESITTEHRTSTLLDGLQGPVGA